MSRYVVKFFKGIVGNNGYEADVCQGALEVDALSAHVAAEQGKRDFCDHQRLRDWSLRADRFSVEQTEHPS
jgi:hypothetical protein